MSQPVQLGDFSWDRMILAVENVKKRLLKAATVLESAGIDYAVVEGNAVAAWVARVDVAAVRNTQDVDILLRRSDLAAATAALERAGFVYRHAMGIDMFLDGPQAKARDAVHVIFAGEKVRQEYDLPAPGVEESDQSGDYRVLSLNALVRMKLTSFRDKDRTHLRDFMEVGLVDSNWLNRLPESLSRRLQQLLDTPDG